MRCLRLFPFACLGFALGAAQAADAGKPASAPLTLGSLFRDHAVLQQAMPVPIWGWAAPAEQVVVTFQGQRVAATAAPNGRWAVTLAPLRATAEGTDLVVRTASTVVVRDVVVGEVWLCSGQSNMLWPVARVPDAERVMAAAAHPNIRQFSVARQVSPAPLDHVEGAWNPCTPRAVRDFTAVGYFFARELAAQLNVPIGIIRSAKSASPIHAWMSEEALRACPGRAATLARWAETVAAYEKTRDAFTRQQANRPAGAPDARPPNPPDSNAPSALYGGMLHPLIPAAIRGVVWYQGESNTDHPEEYAELFTAMLTDWRRRWGRDVPFISVQLPNLDRPRDAMNRTWAFTREGQAASLQLPQTALVVTLDIGDGDVHPANKHLVGARLARAAQALVYQPDPDVARGPMVQRSRNAGKEMVVEFSHAPGGLATRDAQPPAEFELAGADRQFFPARATIRGAQVHVSCPTVPEPVAVRYAWTNNPQRANLTAANGLPVAPFRTDDWPP